MARDSLEPGRHDYASILEGCRRGRYRFAWIRARSGRLGVLAGVSPERLARMSALAREKGVGLILLGSRVSGPRVRQRTLHPALAFLPLVETRRRASAVFAGVEGIEIDKTAIKEFGADDPGTSDLSVVLIDRRGRPGPALDAVAVELEAAFGRLGLSFPTRVFSDVDGRRFRSEREFEVDLARVTGRHAPAELLSERELREAGRELYAALGLPSWPFGLRDVGTGALTAASVGLSFWLALGLHWIVPAVAFGFGFFGRHLARGRAWIAFRWGDGVLSNTAALLFDALLGFAAMAALINPVGGYGLSAAAIAGTGVLHAFSKSTWRLALDKFFSVQHERRQALGVAAATLVNFLLGLATSFVYAGHGWAVAVQGVSASAGAVLLYGPPMRRALSRLPLLRRAQRAVWAG